MNHIVMNQEETQMSQIGFIADCDLIIMNLLVSVYCLKECKYKIFITFITFTFPIKKYQTLLVEKTLPISIKVSYYLAWNNYVNTSLYKL